MPDRWRDDDRDYDNHYDDDTTASSMSRGGRGRGNEDWRHDAYEEGDWKRRRTNEDSYEPVSNHRYDQNGGEDDYYYEDRDRQRDTGSYNNANRQGRARVKASNPSSHVIFLGLHPDFTEENLHAYLSSQGYYAVNATVIRDRHTGMSKSFGFAQFSSLEEAQSFVEPNFPFVTLPPPSYVPPGGYAAEDEDDRTRRVKIDYSQSANPNSEPSRRNGTRIGGGADANDGTRDIGSAHVPVILLRGLDSTSTPEAIGETLRESEGPGKKSAKGMKRVILIRDRASKISLGIAFVEFVDVQSASIVLANTMSPTLFPNGFRVSMIPVAASFAHPHSFRLAEDGYPRDETCIDASESLGGRDSGYARYWDDNCVISEMVYEVVEEKPGTSSGKKGKEKEKKRTKEGHGAAKDDTIRAPTALKASAAPVSLSFKPVKTGGQAIQIKPLVGLSDNKLAASSAFGNHDEEDEAGASPAEDPRDKSSTYRRVAPMIASKKVANNIMKWNTVQGDMLQGDAPGPSTPPTEVPPAVTAPRPTPVSAPAPAAKASAPVAVPKPTAVVEVSLEYGDTVKLACLLCSRQFKSLDQLKRHTAESDLHKKNLGDAALCETARSKADLARKNAASTPSTSSDPSAPKYRDRAQERRTIYGQPDVPLPEGASSSTAGGSGEKRKFAEGPSAPGPPKPATPPPPPLNPGRDDSNKGNMLLKKMGWATGTGLGLSGEGRVDPIATAIYVQGAGLGASKGKDLEKMTNPFDYASNVKDVARERYESS